MSIINNHNHIISQSYYPKSTDSAEHVTASGANVPQTIEFWGGRGIDLNAEDCREIIDSVIRFIYLLDAWDRDKEKSD